MSLSLRTPVNLLGLPVEVRGIIYRLTVGGRHIREQSQWPGSPLTYRTHYAEENCYNTLHLWKSTAGLCNLSGDQCKMPRKRVGRPYMPNCPVPSTGHVIASGPRCGSCLVSVVKSASKLGQSFITSPISLPARKVFHGALLDRCESPSEGSAGYVDNPQLRVSLGAMIRSLQVFFTYSNSEVPKRVVETFPNLEYFCLDVDFPATLFWFPGCLPKAWWLKSICQCEVFKSWTIASTI